MGFWSAIVVIALIAAITIMVRSKHAAAPRFDARDDPPAREEEALEAEIAELKERIAVLERIATDERRSLGLAEEIEQLRDR